MNQESCCYSNEGCCTDPEFKSVNSLISLKDILGSWKARWGIGRMEYKVDTGIYSLGSPNDNSPVIVSANYKMTFDILRKDLSGLNCWLLILDTKGINVWCAAGKGTFGTAELINKIEQTNLSNYIKHKNLILPQLGATGVSAHEVKQKTGYHVIYGPVRSADIKEFIANNFTATKEMRRVKFDLWDRLVLTPIEVVPAFKKLFIIIGGMFFANLFIKKPFEKSEVSGLTGATLSGTIITPALLPYIPGKAFSVKGWIIGLLFAICSMLLNKSKSGSSIAKIGYLLLYPAISSYLALNFTGASTYTSPSGVQKEMKKSLPFIISGVALGGLLVVISHIFIRSNHDKT